MKEPEQCGGEKTQQNDQYKTRCSFAESDSRVPYQGAVCPHGADGADNFQGAAEDKGINELKITGQLPYSQNQQKSKKTADSYKQVMLSMFFQIPLL